MSFFNTTLKRNSKLDLSRSELLRLVSTLEAELQAREIVIAVLKSEQIKRLLIPTGKFPPTISGFKNTKQLNQCSNTGNVTELGADQTIKYSNTDPLVALSRDSFALYEPSSLDHNTTLALYNIKIHQLENLIKSQQKLRITVNERLKWLETRHENLLKELDEERRKNQQYETVYQDFDREKLESKINSLNQELNETKDQVKQMILTLLHERKHLILKLIEERYRNEQLEMKLSSEKGKVAEMVEGLEDESKRSLQMEAELEKYLTDFEKERAELKNQLQLSENKNHELITEMERLKNTVEMLQAQLAGSGIAKTTKDNNSQKEETARWNLGEGVRSSIVTMPVAPKVHSMSSVNPVFHPKASVAQPITTKSPAAAGTAKVTTTTTADTNPNIILPPPSIPVPPQPSSKTVCNHQNSSSSKTAAETKTKENSIISNSTESETKPPPPPTTAAISSSSDNNSVKQTVMFYESTAVTKPATTTICSVAASPTVTASVASKPAASSVKGPRPTPPPIPPNKPAIKPVLPSFKTSKSGIAGNSTSPQTKVFSSSPSSNTSSNNSTAQAVTSNNNKKS